MNDPADVFALPEKLRVLVTAGASGIGRAAADLLIARGALVHICDVSDEFLAEYRAAHPNAGATRADVASDTDVARLFDDVKASPWWTRRADQQCRGRRANRRRRGDQAGRLAAHHRRLPDRAIPLRPLRVAEPQGCRRGFDRKSVLGCGAIRLRVPNSIFCRQVWHHWIDPKPRERAGAC